MTEITDLPNPNNVHNLHIRVKPDPNQKPPMQIVKNLTCKHNNMEIDDKLAEVACGDCGEKLNPMAILVRLANEDDQLYRRREYLKREVAIYKDKLRFKCGSCGQLNNVTKPLHSRTLGEGKQ